jgi:hypothetical protein
MIKRSPFPYRSPAFPGNAVSTRSPVPLPIGNGNGNALLRYKRKAQPFPLYFEGCPDPEAGFLLASQTGPARHVGPIYLQRKKTFKLGGALKVPGLSGRRCEDRGVRHPLIVVV